MAWSEAWINIFESFRTTTFARIHENSKISKTDEKNQQDIGQVATDEPILLDSCSIKDAVEPRRSSRIRDRKRVSHEKTNGRHDRLDWEEVIKDKLNLHMINNTRDQVPRPQGQNIIDCIRVFTIKLDKFGKILEYKARLVSRDFIEQYLIDSGETFSPCHEKSKFLFFNSFC